MPFWKNSEGKILVDATGRPIKCEDCPCGERPTVSCGGCTQPVPAEITVDLGAGGWINNLCNDCETIAGEYVLSNIGSGFSCTFRYTESVCPFPWTNCGTDTFLTVQAQVFSGSCNVSVTLSRPLASNCGLAETRAAYSAAFSDSTCRELLELTKTSEAVGTYCTGSLPNTITVDTR